MRIPFERVIEQTKVLEKLECFDPVVIGTPPLGIDIGSSDIDIACSSDDQSEFESVVTREFNRFDSFQCRTACVQNHHSTIVQFNAFQWNVELFCQSIPTNQQRGVRHFNVEKKILELNPAVGKRIVQLKRKGLKTEPAFASVLGLSGDSYLAIFSYLCPSNDLFY